MKKIFIPILLSALLFFPLAVHGSGDPFSQTKFVPAISFILDVSYLDRGLSETEGFEIPGFLHAGHSHGHAHSGSLVGGDQGFNFNYAEMSLFATVDPYFDLFTSFHLGRESFEVEEAYVTTRKLPHGFGMKIGKFLSSIGRLNNQHAHTWNFQEVPLVYQVFFGEEGLNELGVQLNWVAPTDFFLTLGVEVLQGENTNSFGLESEDLNGEEEAHEDHEAHEEDPGVENATAPGLFTLFGKTSVDIGNLVILGGVSVADGATRSQHESEEGEHILSGRSRVTGFDLTLKYLIDSYRYISLQSEYLHRKFSGDLFGEFHHDEAHGENNMEHESHDEGPVSFSRTQAGFYSELVFRFSKLWRTAFRFDMLNRNRMEMEGETERLPENLKRYSFMIDYSPTEFSRIRLQYNFNQYLYYNGDLKNFGELNLQLNIAVGAHGAHPF